MSIFHCSRKTDVFKSDFKHVPTEFIVIANQKIRSRGLFGYYKDQINFIAEE